MVCASCFIIPNLFTLYVIIDALVPPIVNQQTNVGPAAAATRASEQAKPAADCHLHVTVFDQNQNEKSSDDPFVASTTVSCTGALSRTYRYWHALILSMYSRSFHSCPTKYPTSQQSYIKAI